MPSTYGDKGIIKLPIVIDQLKGVTNVSGPRSILITERSHRAILESKCAKMPGFPQEHHVALKEGVCVVLVLTW